MSNTADVTGGMPISVGSQSIPGFSGVNAINPSLISVHNALCISIVDRSFEIRCFILKPASQCPRGTYAVQDFAITN
jgi:hypothetical protein